MNDNEKLLVEAVRNKLMEIGVEDHENEHEESGKSERGLEYFHQQIDDMFHVKVANLTHYDSVCRAFCKVHSHKAIDDPKFVSLMKQELQSEGVPANEQSKAADFVEAIIKELDEEDTSSNFHHDLDDIMNMGDMYKEN